MIDRFGAEVKHERLGRGSNSLCYCPIGGCRFVLRCEVRYLGLAMAEEPMKRCNDCGTTKPDWRGFHNAHVRNKGLGGSKINKETVVVCAPCHFKKRHGIKEVKSEPQFRWLPDDATPRVGEGESR